MKGVKFNLGVGKAGIEFREGFHKIDNYCVES